MLNVHARLVVLAAALLLLPGIAAAEGKTKLVVLQMKPLSGFPAETAQTISEFIQSEVNKLGVYDTIGASEIQAMIGLERQRQLLGCSDEDGSACMAEIANAMDADRSLSGRHLASRRCISPQPLLHRHPHEPPHRARGQEGRRGAG